MSEECGVMSEECGVIIMSKDRPAYVPNALNSLNSLNSPDSPDSPDSLDSNVVQDGHCVALEYPLLLVLRDIQGFD
jgi:hypothetical protein